MARSHSRSPGYRDRDRSRSPVLEGDGEVPRPDRSRQKAKSKPAKGFKWKDDKNRASERSSAANRYEERERERQTEPLRQSDRRDAPEEQRGGGRREGSDRFRDSGERRDRREDRISERPRRDRHQGEESEGKSRRNEKTESTSWETAMKPAAPAPAPMATYQEPMIIVNVNDRLGTKAAIPCLASDPIRAFKALVAARIGREPHEIMLKRQGERPFKDQLTLEDYGVSNGVQLDLEVDTGD